MSRVKKHILVVDDESEVLELLSEYFESQSYIVSKASDATEGMQILNTTPDIAMVLSDIGLPGMSGIDFLKIARETKEETPVVMITGLRSLDNAISAIKNGAQDFITKPFSLDEVHKAVEKVLRYRLKKEQKARIWEYSDAMTADFSVPTREADPGVISHFIAKFLLHSGFCHHDEYNQWHVAIMETVINAIEHGNLELPSVIKGDDFEKIMRFEALRESRLRDPEFGNRLIKIRMDYNKQCFSLTIADEGPGFDWKKYLQAMQDDEVSTKPYGRGFMLIRHVIDQIDFNMKGNSITLVKNHKRIDRQRLETASGSNSVLQSS